MVNTKKSNPFCEHTFYQENLKLLQKPVLIGYSGGLDSHVLLHFFAQLKQHYPQIECRSVYIDHGLQAISTQWISHCQQIAKSLHIEHQTITLSLDTQTGESLEALARKARYAAIKRYLLDDETLITAHHQNDQAETLLLQLFRGSGVAGLASMPVISNNMGFQHWRPLLNYSQHALCNYAQRHQLQPVEDPSNHDYRFDRNYIRHELIPTLQERWPAITATLSQVANNQAEASTIVDQYSQDKLTNVQGSTASQLSSRKLKKETFINQKALIRLWIKNAGFLAPSTKKLQHIINDVLESKIDASPLVTWGNVAIRRYRDNLYVMAKLSKPPSELKIPWDLKTDLVLTKYNLPTVEIDKLASLKSILQDNNTTVTIRIRQGGERMQPTGHSQEKTLKSILQEQAIPPWERERLPLVFANEILIYIHNIATIDPGKLIESLSEGH